MKNTYLAILVALVAISCSPRSTSVESVICGEVVGADESSPKVLTLFPYEFAQSGDRLAFDISQSGFKFHQKFTMTHRHDVVISYNGELYLFMAEPSDSIFVSIDAKSKSIVYSGSKAQFNTQLNQGVAVVDSKFGEISRLNLDASVEEVADELEENMNIIRETLDSYCAENSIDEGVKSYLLSNTLYCFANGVEVYDFKNRYSPERYRLVTHEIFDIYNPSHMQSFMYYLHLQNSTYDFMSSEPELREELHKKDLDVAKIGQLLLQHILKLPKSAVRDVRLTCGAAFMNNLAERRSEGAELFYDERYLDPNNYSNTKFLERYVEPIFQTNESAESHEKVGDFDIESDAKYINGDNEVERLDGVNIMDYIKTRYRGKVLYIDVWATGCGPCIEEMGYAKKLYEIYSQREDIAFVNLCLSSKVESWVECIEKNEIGGENYFVGSDDVSKMLFSAYHLNGYPSYILIDKEGALITTSAFRPSQLGDLSQQLDKCL